MYRALMSTDAGSCGEAPGAVTWFLTKILGRFTPPLRVLKRLRVPIGQTKVKKSKKKAGSNSIFRPKRRKTDLIQWVSSIWLLVNFAFTKAQRREKSCVKQTGGTSCERKRPIWGGDGAMCAAPNEASRTQGVWREKNPDLRDFPTHVEEGFNA